MLRSTTKKRDNAYMGPVPLRFKGDDQALALALRTGHPGAMEALYDRYGAHVERVLVRVMGFDAELYDLVQEVFVEAFTNMRSLKDGHALKAWMTTLAVFTARQRIRKRRRRRAYWVRDADEQMEVPVSGVDPSELEALRLTYRVLSALPADDRIVFSLRFIEGMEVAEVALACRVSLSTVKRRLKRAQKRFTLAAERFPVLTALLEEGDR